MKNYIIFDIDRKYARQVNTTLCVRAKKSLKIFYAVRLIKNGTGRAED